MRKRKDRRLLDRFDDTLTPERATRDEVHPHDGWSREEFFRDLKRVTKKVEEPHPRRKHSARSETSA